MGGGKRGKRIASLFLSSSVPLHDTSFLIRTSFEWKAITAMQNATNC